MPPDTHVIFFLLNLSKIFIDLIIKYEVPSYFMITELSNSRLVIQN